MKRIVLGLAVLILLLLGVACQSQASIGQKGATVTEMSCVRVKPLEIRCDVTINAGVFLKEGAESISWEWGDDTPSTTTISSENQVSAKHTYEKSGFYHITLTVIFSDGRRITVEDAVNMHAISK